MQFQQVIVIAAAVLAFVAVVAQAHTERPEPNADICPGKHTDDTCTACCKSHQYLQHQVQAETEACVCDLYYNTGSNFFNHQFFQDRMVAQKLDEPFKALDKDLYLKRVVVLGEQKYQSVDGAKIEAKLNLISQMEALVGQLKVKSKEYYDLLN